MSYGTKSAMESCTGEESTQGERSYPSTIWSEVGRAGRLDEDASLEALSGLLEKYYRPLKRHLQLAFQAEPDVAAEWLHEFVHRKMLLGNLLRRASRNKGRFRTFLLNALDNFVRSEKRRENAQKRKPAQGVVSLQDLPSGWEIPAPSTHLQEFSREWAREVVGQTLAKMESECLGKGEARRWKVFKKRLLEPALEDVEPVPYEKLVTEFQFESPAEASNCLITARRQFRRLLREVVAEYVGGEDIESELRRLQRSLAP